MATQEIINILERTGTGCKCSDEQIEIVVDFVCFYVQLKLIWKMHEIFLRKRRNKTQYVIFIDKNRFSIELTLFQPELLKHLSDILIAATNNPIARAQAGEFRMIFGSTLLFISLALQLKNALYSKEENLQQVYQDRWLNMPANIRDHIKTNVKISYLLF